MTSESEFERRARELLRETASNVDGATRSRLTQARHAALAEVEKSPRRHRLQLLIPGSAVAAVVLALVLWNGVGPGQPGGAAMDDLELLADSEAYELSQEPDLDFIEWAAAMGDASAGT